VKGKILVLLVAFAAFSCKGHKQTKSEQSDVVVNKADTVPLSRITPLEPGEIHLTEKAFGPVIDLKGISHPVKEVFRVVESQMLAEDSLLLVKTRYNDHLFMAYSLPGFRFIKSFGRLGQGPDEFQFPRMFRSRNSKRLAYVFESTRNKLYSLDRDFVTKELKLAMPASFHQMYSDKQMQCIYDSTFAYVESVKGGKGIFKLSLRGDSATAKKLYNLTFSEKLKNWAAYIGDFGLNPDKKRMVFAYKQFNRLVFVDCDSMKTRTLIFDDSKDHKFNTKDVMSPANITYFWGISPQRKYVYLLYSGRTPIDVMKANNHGNEFIYVEQFDWNGNPVHKYRLDHWGYFCVSEDENTIYLSSTVDENPFYSYDIPNEK